VVLEEQGKKVAAAISGSEYYFTLPACVRSFRMDGIMITVLGDTREKESMTVRQKFDPESGRYKRFYIENDCLTGAVLMNADDEQAELLRQINEKSVFTFNDDAPQSVPASEGNEGATAEAGSENVSTELVDN
jgi:NAD(P)H-nitrite reductase large subunit